MQGRRELSINFGVRVRVIHITRLREMMRDGESAIYAFIVIIVTGRRNFYSRRSIFGARNPKPYIDVDCSYNNSKPITDCENRRRWESTKFQRRRCFELILKD
jgi:hypothetical protein